MTSKKDSTHIDKIIVFASGNKACRNAGELLEWSIEVDGNEIGTTLTGFHACEFFNELSYMMSPQYKNSIKIEGDKAVYELNLKDVKRKFMAYNAVLKYFPEVKKYELI